MRPSSLANSGNTIMRRFLLATLTGLLIGAGWRSETRGADWPAFRGPTGQGVAADTQAPTTWSAETQVLWKTALPRPGNGSPIVVGNRVFVTSAEDADGKQRSLYAFDTNSGRQLWVKTETLDRKLPTHETNPYGGTTPVSDGKRVVVWHATAGLCCYDVATGELQWKRDLGEFQHMWGYGTSPILHQDKVILHTGPGKRIFLAAFELATGKTIWEVDEPQDGGPDRNAAGQYMGSWTTPIVVSIEGQEQMIVGWPTRVNGYDPATGKLLWTCGGMRHDRGDLAYSSPVVTDGICFVTGGFNGVALAFRPGGSGDITDTRMLWRKEKQPQSIGSGVAVNGFVYRPNAGPSTIECLEAATGKVRWTERSPAGNHWGSVVRVGDLLYVTGQDSATTVVFKPNPDKFEVVAVNPLEGSSNSTPAIAGGRIYLRTDRALWCIGPR
ncbi:MAG: PQQ-binding-like beta-propeller repeat protein, partial [Planctomycetota bacterium]